jgi:hypothetical protein
LHEAAHGLAAYSLGVPVTLFHFYVDLRNPNRAAPAWIAVAGPLFLVLGLACWLAYKKFRARPATLPLLYAAIFGIGIFVGNLMSASFVGDIATLASALDLPRSIRMTVTLAGAVSLCAFMYRMGRELAPWAAPDASRWRAVAAVIAWPVILGTALVILAFLPLPNQFMQAWIAESGFWLCAGIGVFRNVGRVAARDAGLSIQPAEYVFATVALLLVRALARGIALAS